MQQCFIEANKIRKVVARGDIESNLELIRKYTLYQEGRLYNKAVTEVVRIANTRQVKIDYIVMQFEEN